LKKALVWIGKQALATAGEKIAEKANPKRKKAA
jgi:hypothetical protein